MNDTPQDIPEGPEAPRDLRAELFENLSTQFAAALKADGSLPTIAQEALIELLDSETSTAAQIIAAASKLDTEEVDGGNG